MPEPLARAECIFGHIRLYTPTEVILMMSQRGFSLERSVLESNNSAYRGASKKSMRRRLYRLYERLEQRLKFLRGLGDTWYMVFRRNSGELDLTVSKSRHKD